ncbi:MAG: hypothetical protein RL095_2700 [Verrucomicrobiota bacterium]|jgi:Tfp pilus assembly protein PilE
MERRKFTLLELLVVVCIILVLISLLMPAVRKSLQRAKFAVCVSNISQVYRGEYIYSNNNNAYLTPSYIPSNRYSWDDLLSSYVSAPRTEEQMEATEVPVSVAKGNIFQCPMDKNGTDKRRSFALAGGIYGDGGGGVYHSGVGTYDGWSQRMTGGKGPTSDRVMLREINHGQKQGGSWISYANFDWGWGSGLHHKGDVYFNTIFKDGHHEYLNADQFYSRYYQPGHNTPSGN